MTGEGFCLSSLGTHTKSGCLTAFVSAECTKGDLEELWRLLGFSKLFLMHIRPLALCTYGALEEYLPKLRARSPTPRPLVLHT